MSRDKQPAKPAVAADAAAAAATHVEQGRFKTSAGEAHVGYLITNVEGSMAAPSQYCLDDGSLYAGAPYRLGRINVFFSGAVSPKALNGPAIIYGRRHRGLDRKITRVGPCPPAADKGEVPQLRSDWVADEADWRGHTTRARLAKADYIEAVAVYPLPLVAVQRTGATSLQLVLTNPFDRPLGSTATFSLYYEGGPTKPMPNFEPQSLDNLAPGSSKTFTVTVPAPTSAPLKAGRGRRVFRGYQLKGTLGDVRLDLLVSVPTH